MSFRKRRLLAGVGLLLAALVLVPLAMRFSGRPRDASTSPLATLAVADAPAARPERSSVPDACAGPTPPAVNADFEARVVELVNERRGAAGLPPLKPVEQLSSSARWFARSMATQDYFVEDHDTYVRAGGQLRRVCDWGDRIAWFYPGWTALGETIAAGSATPQDVVEGWMQSPPHRARILSASQREAGAGYWAGGSRGHYWVLDLGRRRASPRP